MFKSFANASMKSFMDISANAMATNALRRIGTAHTSRRFERDTVRYISASNTSPTPTRRPGTVFARGLHEPVYNADISMNREAASGASRDALRRG